MSYMFSSRGSGKKLKSPTNIVEIVLNNFSLYSHRQVEIHCAINLTILTQQSIKGYEN